MNLEQMEKQLFQLSEREIFHKTNKTLSDHYDLLKRKMVHGQLVYVVDDRMSSEENFTITKHNRFVPVPLHVHDFIELNYVYSGKCTQVINQKKVTLEKGDICLIDTGIPHSIEYTEENDIIINILIKKDFFSKQLSKESFCEGIILDFILTSLSEKHTHDQYIIFNKNIQEAQVRIIFQEILKEFFSDQIGRTRIIGDLISILFTLLVREFDYQTNMDSDLKKRHTVDILQYIDKNYKTVTLKELSEKFNYAPSYLSYLIKKETSHTFSQLVLEKKLRLANNLIISSEDSITACALEAGFTNITFFYEKYKNYYGRTPNR